MLNAQHRSMVADGHGNQIRDLDLSHGIWMIYFWTWCPVSCFDFNELTYHLLRDLHESHANIKRCFHNLNNMFPPNNPWFDHLWYWWNRDRQHQVNDIDYIICAWRSFARILNSLPPPTAFTRGFLNPHGEIIGRIVTTFLYKGRRVYSIDTYQWSWCSKTLQEELKTIQNVRHIDEVNLISSLFQQFIKRKLWSNRALEIFWRKRSSQFYFMNINNTHQHLK